MRKDTHDCTSCTTHHSIYYYYLVWVQALYTNKYYKRDDQAVAAHDTWEIELLNAHASEISALRYLTKLCNL